MDLYIIKYSYYYNGKNNYEDLIPAYSSFDAKINWVKDKFLNINFICQGHIININNILLKYYKVNPIYIRYIKDKLPEYIYVAHWTEVKQYIKEYINDGYMGPEFDSILTDFLNNYNIKIPNIIDVIELKNDKVIGSMISNGYFNIQVHKYNPTTKITYFTLKRLSKKIKNSNYWNILRLL